MSDVLVQSKPSKMLKLDDYHNSRQIKNSSRLDSDESKSINSNNGIDLETCLCFFVFYLKFN